MKILWTKKAENQLMKIYAYYKHKVSIKVAKSIKQNIFDRTEILRTHPKSGQSEELLKDSGYEYRYLVESNFKIIYWIEKDIVNIAAVFDCRRNPENLTV
jgi:plasmid stabilization system protein ParE